MIDIIEGVPQGVGGGASVEHPGWVTLSSLPCELSAEAVPFLPLLSMSSAEASVTCTGARLDGRIGQEQPAEEAVIQRRDMKEELTAISYCRWFPAWTPAVKKDLNV